jgi:hypothetical protein
LDSSDDGIPVSWRNEIILNGHELSCFDSSFFCLRDVEIHFVAVEIGVVGFADTFIETECSIGTDFDAMGEDT